MSKQLILHNRLFFLNLMSFFGGFVFYAPVALLVRTRCGITEAQFFLLEPILSVSIFFFEVPCGLLSDRLGYKNTLIVGSCFLFAARLLMFCSDRFWLFAVEAVAEGIASALFPAPFPPICTRWSRRILPKIFPKTTTAPTLALSYPRWDFLSCTLTAESTACCFSPCCFPLPRWSALSF